MAFTFRICSRPIFMSKNSISKFFLYCRYKAEVDVDGRELARYYLSQQNIDTILTEIKTIETNQDLELFMLKHGESLVDCLGEQVDRIEKELKHQHPELRHVDLEVL